MGILQQSIFASIVDPALCTPGASHSRRFALPALRTPYISQQSYTLQSAYASQSTLHFTQALCFATTLRVMQPAPCTSQTNCCFAYRNRISFIISDSSGT